MRWPEPTAESVSAGAMTAALPLWEQVHQHHVNR
jgi:hypothetical protein